MKKIIAIVAILGIALQTFNQVVIVAQYYANKDFIAKNLCENRDKPQMHCDGKCCLKKKLAKQGKEQAPSPQNEKNEVVNLFYSDARLAFTTPIFSDPLIQYFNYDELGTRSFHGTVFHPPSV